MLKNYIMVRINKNRVDRREESVLDDLIKEVRNSENLNSDRILQGIQGLSYLDQIIYGSILSEEIGTKEIDNFEKEDDRKEILTTLRVINICAASELDKMAYEDALTGLPNRRKWDEKEVPENVSYGVLMFDIDKFKSWNDTYGHGIGDIALKVMGYILGTKIREGFAGRYGGEEFYAILEEIESPDQVYAAGERVRKILEEEGMDHLYELLDKEVDSLKSKKEIKEAEKLTEKIHELKKNNATLTVSVGYAIGKGEELETTKNYADIALYNAKENGRNQVMQYTLGMTMPENNQ